MGATIRIVLLLLLWMELTRSQEQAINNCLQGKHLIAAIINVLFQIYFPFSLFSKLN